MAILWISSKKEENSMLTKIQKWGNSQGLRLPKMLLSSLHIDVGDEVAISVDKGALHIVPIKKIRGKYTLENLVAQIPEDYQPEEMDWGKPTGREAW
jgi:antitoxin MazE